MKFLVLIILFFQVVLNAAAYDINRSKLINKYANIIHCPKEKIVDWSCKICQTTQKMTDVVYIHNNRTNVVMYIAFNPSQKEIIVSWQGTKDAKNWIEDLAFQLAEYPRCRNCKVHEGFYFDYVSVREQTIKVIGELLNKYSQARLTVTGSSLGSALATISAIEYHLIFRRPTQLHNFGCPRVGNLQFSNFVNLNIQNRIRVVHNRDLVPHIPYIQLGYHHYSAEVLFDEDMKEYKVCDDSGEDPSCSNRFFPNYSVQDHITYWIRPHDDIC